MSLSSVKRVWGWHYLAATGCRRPGRSGDSLSPTNNVFDCFTHLKRVHASLSDASTPARPARVLPFNAHCSKPIPPGPLQVPPWRNYFPCSAPPGGNAPRREGNDQNDPPPKTFGVGTARVPVDQIIKPRGRAVPAPTMAMVLLFIVSGAEFKILPPNRWSGNNRFSPARCRRTGSGDFGGNPR